MSKVNSEIGPEYRRKDLGKGVHSNYARFERGTNLVLLNDEIAKAFPTAHAVNEALASLLILARQVSHSGSKGRTPRKRAL